MLTEDVRAGTDRIDRDDAIAVLLQVGGDIMAGAIRFW